MFIDTILEKIQYNEDDLRTKHDGIAAVIMKGDKILMMDHVKFNFWTIPVGKVDENQSVEDGFKMEIGEELGIKPIKYKEIHKFVKRYKRESKMVTVTSHIFLIEKWTGTIRNNEPKKHRSIKWMTVDEIKKQREISDATKEALKVIEKI